MAINHSYVPGIGICLGVFHVICGIISIGCGIALLVYDAELSHVAVGIWAGILFYILTGVLGFAASTKNNGAITAYYILALLTVFVSMAQMGVHSWAVYEEALTCSRMLDFDHYSTCPYYLVRNVVIDGIVVLTAFVEWILAMVSCCTACVCCFRSDPPQPQTVMVTTMQQPMVGQQAWAPTGMVMTQAPHGGGPATVMMQPQQAAYGGGFPAAGYPGFSGNQAYNSAASGNPNEGFDTNDEKPILP